MKNTFIIGIDDGDCCYQYPLTIKDGYNISIRDVYETLCKAYEAEPKEGIYMKSKAKEVKTILDIKD